LKKKIQEEIQEDDLLEYLPDKETTLYIMVITNLLSRKGTQSLGDFEVQYLHDPKVVAFVKEWVLINVSKLENYAKNMIALFQIPFALVSPVIGHEEVEHAKENQARLVRPRHCPKLNQHLKFKISLYTLTQHVPWTKLVIFVGSACYDLSIIYFSLIVDHGNGTLQGLKWMQYQITCWVKFKKWSETF
jgi:hypothetical protein